MGNGGEILVLFEMPSGFAIFRYDGIKLLLPDACQNIWADFVNDSLAKDVARLLDYIKFEDKDTAINEDTGVSKALAKMILDHRKSGQKLAVGKLDYKRIIENDMDIPCLWCPAVEELMWGLKISMGNFLPTEQSGLTNEDRLLMSQGMKSFLTSHSFDIKPDMMVTKQIIKMAGRLNKCDQCANKYKYFLLAAAEHIVEISHIDTKDWDLLKIATALMMICYPEKKIAAPRWLFTKEQLKIFRKDAPQYENKILKMPLSVAYNEIYWARQLRYNMARQLLHLIKHDKKAREAELASEAASDHEIGMMSRQHLYLWPASDDSSNKPFSVGKNRLEKLSKDSNKKLGKRMVQPENNLSDGGRLLIAEGLDGPPSSSHAHESSAPETLDSTISVKYPLVLEPVTLSQTPGSLASSTSECIAANSFASAPGLSPSPPIGSLTSEKSTMNPNAKEFKLNPNAKSFIPSASLRRPHTHHPAPDTSYYYPNNMPAAPIGPCLPVGMGFPPSYGGQPVMYNTRPGTPPHRVTSLDMLDHSIGSR